MEDASAEVGWGEVEEDNESDESVAILPASKVQESVYQLEDLTLDSTLNSTLTFVLPCCSRVWAVPDNAGARESL